MRNQEQENVAPDQGEIIELTEADLANVAGGINPQPLPPRHDYE
jgi:hypothetical protein